MDSITELLEELDLETGVKNTFKLSELKIGDQIDISTGDPSTIFSDIYDKNGNVYFCKQLLKKDLPYHMRNIIKSERSAGRYLSHPNIVKLYQYLEDSDAHYFIFEKGQMDLYDLYKKNGHKIEYDLLVRFCHQICDALIYLKQKLVIHQDIKPENIVIFDGGIAKLTDFGCSSYNKPITNNSGTGVYRAPEVISFKTGDAKSDVYSFGVVIYGILNNGFPYWNKNKELQFYIDNIPEKMKSLLVGMLQRTRLPRLNITEVKERLNEL